MRENTRLAEKGMYPMTRFEDLAELPMEEGRPTLDTAGVLRDELLFQRAVQSYLLAMPVINTMGMKFASEAKFGSGYNVLPIWKERLSAETEVTTPNSDVLYAMSYVDLGADGPLVLEAPAGLQGILLDLWQRPIPGPTIDGAEFAGDVGFFGPDGGHGGSFLLLPPDYSGEAPDGHHVFRSATRNVFIFLRGFYRDPNDLGPAVAIMEKTRIYPLNGIATAKPMSFPDGSRVAVNMLPVSDGSVFDQLQQIVDSEVDTFASADLRGMLAAIGIVKGKPFTPDAATQHLLDCAARTAYKMTRVIGGDDILGGVSYQVFTDRHWLNPFPNGKPEHFDLSWASLADGHIAHDSRINFFTNYYSVSPGMAFPVAGKGAKYLIVGRDGDGDALSGGRSYQLTLPPDVPAENFWSLTLYDAETSSGLANGQPFPSLGSRDEPTMNADGSTTLYLGPKAPDDQAGNWLATVPGKGYFAILRYYAPTQSGVDNTYKPGDIQKLSS